MNVNLVSGRMIRDLDENDLDQVSGGGFSFASGPGDMNANRTLAFIAATSFAVGAIGYGAAALTALFVKNPNY